jgi:hypothetical protein
MGMAGQFAWGWGCRAGRLRVAGGRAIVKAHFMCGYEIMKRGLAASGSEVWDIECLELGYCSL